MESLMRYNGLLDILEANGSYTLGCFDRGAPMSSFNPSITVFGL